MREFDRLSLGWLDRLDIWLTRHMTDCTLRVYDWILGNR
jgi:hypothetical protein